ncbi:MAG: RagB/SusD family nutrient uptake outer membrane protein [Prevotella sp.]|nr:RagB/SusD family nutrient uptake outer membrane protein [Prevotella sp.]
MLCAALITYHSSLITSCSDFLYDDSDIVTYADKNHLTSDADTLWSVAGIMNKLQVVADRTILLGELRGDLVSVTPYADADIRDVASFNIGTDNRYNDIADYYAIVNNCNYFLANADTALRNSRNETIFMKEYAAVKAYRAWTYLQLATIYGRVPLITEPILTKEQGEKDYKECDIQEICRYFAADIAPYADMEMPGYGAIRNTDSRLFYFPIYILLGDLHLWAGNYREAAENYYKYITTRNGKNSSYPLSTASVRFSPNDSHWMQTVDGWSYIAFQTENRNGNAELITMIPGDSIPSEGNYSQLRNLFNTTEQNEYRESIVPSQSLYLLSAAQKYCHYSSGGEYVIAPAGLPENRSGDLRLQAVFTQVDNANIMLNGKRVTNYVTNAKYATRNVHIYRRAMVYLRMAEALNRAGFPRFAFQILKRGVNNSVMESEVIPYYPADEAWLRTFNFPDNMYSLETTAGQTTENTMGLHSRGSGYSAANTTYEMPTDDALSDDALLQYQIEKVEDLIIDEEALEFAFEGHRFYDLMRVSVHRSDPAYLASRVARRNGTVDAALLQKLSSMDNWYLEK